MEIIEKKVIAKDYLTKSNLPDSDFVINPYVGCPHGCMYCYASFMKRFTGHKEEWGTFIDIKQCDKPINKKKVTGKSIFLSSVTDCYNEFEKKYCVTRRILEQLLDVDCQITISTKSSLILRDVDLLQQLKNLKVACSVNTLDEGFRSDMDKGSLIAERLEALKILHDSGIYPAYIEIYVNKNNDYWKNLADLLENYCTVENINYVNYFYHEELVKAQNRGKIS